MEALLPNRGFVNRLVAFEAKPARSLLLWPSALLAGWAFDFLFWDKLPGISFPIFVVVVVLCGLAVARSVAAPISTQATWLLVPILFFSFAFAVRSEPLTLVLDVLATLGLLALMADSLVKGRWVRYRLGDYLIAAIHLALAGLIGGAADLIERRDQRSTKSKSARFRGLGPVAKGIAIAIPFLFVFGLLLSSADPIFSRLLRNPLRWWDMSELGEYVFRMALVLLLAYCFAGVFLHAVRKNSSEEDSTVASADPSAAPLGFVEGMIVLGSVTVLFAAFVAVQFRYFFAGELAITRLGMTYAEYARRGFGELVGVAGLTLLLFIALSFLVRRETTQRYRTFALLSTGLVILTGVILASAFQRLLLYEGAYGFTRLRMYSHIFMVWLGLLLLAVLVLQWGRQLRAFALVLVLAAIGFTASLNLIGIDALIVNRNIDRAMAGAKFDPLYLSGLSSEGMVVLVDRVGDLPAAEQRTMSGFLICEALESGRRKSPWQSFNVSRERARRALNTYLRQNSAATPWCIRPSD